MKIMADKNTNGKIQIYVGTRLSGYTIACKTDKQECYSIWYSQQQYQIDYNTFDDQPLSIDYCLLWKADSVITELLGVRLSNEELSNDNKS